MTPSLVGMADNGDFGRVMYPFGLEYTTADQSQRYFNYVNQFLAFGTPSDIIYPTSTLWIVGLAVGVNKALHSALFDLSVLGDIYAVLFAAGVFLLVRGLRRAVPSFAAVAAACLAGALVLYHLVLWCCRMRPWQDSHGKIHPPGAAPEPHRSRTGAAPEPHRSPAELEQRYRQATEGTVRGWWQILWLLSRGQTAKEIAESTGYSRYGIGQLAKRYNAERYNAERYNAERYNAERYNAEGVAGMRDRRHTDSRRAPVVLSGEQVRELRLALQGPAPHGERWSGRVVAEWIGEKLGRPVRSQLGWDYLIRRGGRPRVPRPRHVRAPIRPRRSPAKKVAAAAAAGADRLPCRGGRAVGNG
jgi:hypothetical protein